VSRHVQHVQRKPPLRLLGAWFGLLLLLGMTVSLAYVRLGWANTAIAFGIAAVKASLVALLFMELAEHQPLARIFAAAGLFWLAIMFWLAFNDYATRAGFPPAAAVGATSGVPQPNTSRP
jgi:cytochrome c oxidase subunit 4